MAMSKLLILNDFYYHADLEMSSDFLAIFAVAAHAARKKLGLAEPGHVPSPHRNRVGLRGAGEVARIVGGLRRHQPHVVHASPAERDRLAGSRGQCVGAAAGVHALPVDGGCGRRGEDAWEQSHCVRMRGLLAWLFCGTSIANIL